MLILEGEEFTEAASIYDVQHIILADISPGLAPPSWMIHQQRVGRALRMCRHQNLKEAERKLHIYLYVATVDPQTLPPPYTAKSDFVTLDEIKLFALDEDRVAMRQAYEQLQDDAVDKGLWGLTAPSRTIANAQNWKAALHPSKPSAPSNTKRTSVSREGSTAAPVAAPPAPAAPAPPPPPPARPPFFF